MVHLQTALDALTHWADNWQLSISINKCCVLYVGKVSHHVDVCLAGTSMPVAAHTRDLGIIVTNDLSPSHHIAVIVAQAHKRAGAILCDFSSRDTCLLMRAFLVYVRPVVEYSSIIWSPATIHNIDSLESVQHRFTKRLPGLNNLNYYDRLQSLNVPTLELYNLCAVFWCYRVVFGLAYVHVNEFFEFSPCQNTRGHKYKLFKCQTACVRSDFFCERVVNVWNSA